MTCKIQPVVTSSGLVVLRVSGYIDCTHVETLWGLMDQDKAAKVLAIDLTEVTLVSREAIDILDLAETNGIDLKNCPAYVREWISRQRRDSGTKLDHDLFKGE